MGPPGVDGDSEGGYSAVLGPSVAVQCKYSVKAVLCAYIKFRTFAP